MQSFPHERCIQLLGLEAIEALAAKSEPNRHHFEKVSVMMFSVLRTLRTS